VEDEIDYEAQDEAQAIDEFEQDDDYEESPFSEEEVLDFANRVGHKTYMENLSAIENEFEENPDLLNQPGRLQRAFDQAQVKQAAKWNDWNENIRQDVYRQFNRTRADNLQEETIPQPTPEVKLPEHQALLKSIENTSVEQAKIEFNNLESEKK